MKNKERLDHALHNEKVCEHLATTNDFKDWVITTAFYSSLQFVTYKIFPFKIKSTSGTEVSIDNVDVYRKVSKPNLSKHEALKDLVAEKHPSIHAEYDWLLSMSYTARYINYQHMPEIANRAKALMLKIKTYCNN